MSVMSRIKREIKRRLQVKTPVYIPVMYGELLKGRVAVVTGGTRGIGFSIAEAFLRNGAAVVITGRDQERLDRACTELAERVEEAQVFSAVLDNANIDRMEDGFNRIIQLIGDRRIDIWVNNAGVINRTGFFNAEEEDFDMVLNTDLKGPYFLSKLAAKYMKSQGVQGNILNVTSSSALRPVTTSYGLAKWGMRGFTLGLAKELSGSGIVVNAVAPGPTFTDMLAEGNEINLNRDASPSGRMTATEEIGNIAVMLVSSMGRMINGDTLYITGGCGNLTFDDWV